MSAMTSRERFQCMYEHKEADRIPIIDSPWGATIERWHKEGMPEDTTFVDFFGLDRVARIGVDNSPQFPSEVVEETDDYKVTVTPWGAKLKNWKHIASTPEFIDFRVTDPDTWQEAKKRMKPSRDRVNWDNLRENYPQWKEKGYWIHGGGWFGFDITHSWFVGTERILLAIARDPEWCIDMFNHELEVNLALLDMVWDEGYKFDTLRWPDDMGYKYNQFFSIDTYREILKPIHRRAIEWAHEKGIKAELHSCGNVVPFVAELVEIGLDALNPLEVKAGMDPIELKEQHGDELVLHGGINAVLWDEPDEIKQEMERVIPTVKQNGGYIFSSDHSVPSSVGLEDFRQIVELAKELGSY
ncbi:MAG: uroporphyrinogen decarboxylase family protein [Candidatus Brocadiia bacterium]